MSTAGRRRAAGRPPPRVRRRAPMPARRGPSVVTPPDVRRHAGSDRDGPRIRCPRCAWQPRRDDRWMCRCLHVWNTFETAGVCPGCGHAWPETQCLRCQEWSPHADWYVRDDTRRS